MFSENLKILRKEKGFSQKQLSEMLMICWAKNRKTRRANELDALALELAKKLKTLKRKFPLSGDSPCRQTLKLALVRCHGAQ